MSGVVVPRLLLASASPRRSELLRAAGYDFRVALSSISESSAGDLTIREVTTLNATRKCLDIARVNPEAVVLGADTLVALEEEVIGKPRDLEDARAILRRLSGRTHIVCSAVHLAHRWKRSFVAFHEVTRVTFQRLDDDRITEYFRVVNPLDKAGAYAAQDDAGRIIRKIDGSFSNVVGLPMEKTREALALFGITPR